MDVKVSKPLKKRILDSYVNNGTNGPDKVMNQFKESSTIKNRRRNMRKNKENKLKLKQPATIAAPKSSINKSKFLRPSSPKSKSRALINGLPEYIFRIPGSYSIWKDLIRNQLDAETSRRFHEKISELDANEKYSFASLIIEYGLINALEMVPLVNESNLTQSYILNQMPLVQPRTFCDAATQID
ncbi:hypothetical protein NH340_JMT01395 [Sarcoptes scabiei]|nr:hypothetical protein NH340_JMT01395 [Sarcoptes scabiei]